MTAVQARSVDPYDLTRFLHAQRSNYADAIREVRRGYKTTHWMWYVFPQFLGAVSDSSTSHYYAIHSLDEARHYLAHPVLGTRLLECAEAAVRVPYHSALHVFGSPDDVKLKACCTLFAAVTETRSAFRDVLDRYFRGRRHARTLRLIKGR